MNLTLSSITFQQTKEEPALKVELPSHIRELPIYVPGRPIADVAREFNLEPESIVKLASNENPLGMSALSKAAIAVAMDDAARYPDPNGFSLKAKISIEVNLPPEWITLGSGSSEILELAARAFLAPGVAGLISQYAFTVYAFAVKVTGATLQVVPARDYGHDLNAMAEAILPETKLIYVANPNNPTGTYFSAAEFDTFMQNVNRRAIVLLDEAYQEYLAPAERFDVTQLVSRHDNLIVSRTFSKAHGLAGLRVGYAISGPDITQALNRVRPTFNVNAVALAAAVAALNSGEFLEQSRQVNEAGMDQFARFCKAHRLDFVPSKGNFMLIRVGDAAGLNASLLRQGVIVRPVANYGLPEWLRVSIGTEDENRRFFEAMRVALGEIAV